MADEDLVVGDVVELNSGSVFMTVKSAKDGTVECAWLVNGVLGGEVFPREMLTKVQRVGGTKTLRQHADDAQSLSFLWETYGPTILKYLGPPLQKAFADAAKKKAAK